MFALTLSIEVTKCQEPVFDRAFFGLGKVHNTVVSYAVGRLAALRRDKEYNKLKAEYSKLASIKEPTKADEKRKKAVGKAMNKIIADNGLTKVNLEKYAKVIGHKWRNYLSSQQVQKEADRVWSGVEKVLYSNGKQLHFKKGMDFDTISGKSNKNGAVFYPGSLLFRWMGTLYQCKVPRKMSPEYLKESLTRKISYCEIKRMMFPNGWKYYLIIMLEGNSPLQHEHANEGTMGIDIGTSTVAGVSNEKLFLEILAQGVERYDAEIAKLSRAMDTSRRVSNPNKYNKNGTYKKGNKDRWVLSKNYRKLRRKFKSLNRQRSAFIECSHRKLANKMIRHAVHFITEEMNFQALAKRAKETRRESKPKLIVDRNGRSRYTRKFVRKKRYGHSILARAPSLFLKTLEGKACRYGGELSSVNTKDFKASQYDHVTDTYTKAEIGQRSKKVGDQTVQRDLYSAFLLNNSDNSLMHADRERCSAGFAKFVDLQSELISNMKVSGISRKSCFGF